MLPTQRASWRKRECGKDCGGRERKRREERNLEYEDPQRLRRLKYFLSPFRVAHRALSQDGFLKHHGSKDAGPSSCELRGALRR